MHEQEGKVTVIWAFGKDDLVEKPKSNDYHGQNRGEILVTLIFEAIRSVSIN